MLNQANVEALYSASYVENYLDYVENLPDQIQRYLSRIRDIDVQYRGYLRDFDTFSEQLKTGKESGPKRAKIIARIKSCLIAAQELGDEKLQIVAQLQELIDSKTRQIDLDYKNLDYGKDEHSNEPLQKMPRSTSPGAGGSSSGGSVNNNGCLKNDSNCLSLGGGTQQRSGTPTSQTSERNSSSNGDYRTNSSSAKRARRPRNDNSFMDNDSHSASENGGSSNRNNANSHNNSHHSLNNSMLGAGNGGPGSNGGLSGIASKNKNSGQNNVNNNAGASSGGANKQKKKRKTRQGGNNMSSRDNREDTPPPDPTIDPDEPTYCLCDQISFGEMILCDNDLCPIEWFHFSCVQLITKPKGKWYCPNCRGDRPNNMKPKAQFLKELAIYNKEKEEKT